jgi:hypothetical protein
MKTAREFVAETSSNEPHSKRARLSSESAEQVSQRKSVAEKFASRGAWEREGGERTLRPPARLAWAPRAPGKRARQSGRARGRATGAVPDPGGPRMRSLETGGEGERQRGRGGGGRRALPAVAAPRRRRRSTTTTILFLPNNKTTAPLPAQRRHQAAGQARAHLPGQLPVRGQALAALAVGRQGERRAASGHC